MSHLLNIPKNGLISTVRGAISTLFRVPSVLDTSTASYASYRKVYEGLGLVQPPKKPANAYMRFLSARLAGVKAPKGQATEQFRSSVAAWKQLDPKQRAQYQNDYEKDQPKYKEAVAKWRAALTPAQKQQIKETKHKLDDARTRRASRLQILDESSKLGKPKRVPTGFCIFYKKLSEERSMILSEARSEWANLDASKRQPFEAQSKEAAPRYAEALNAWERKMLQQGKTELVRKSTLLAQRKAAKAAKASTTTPKK